MTQSTSCRSPFQFYLNTAHGAIVGGSSPLEALAKWGLTKSAVCLIIVLMARKYKHFKLYTNQNIMGVVMFSILAGVTGVLIGVVLLYSPVGQVLGISAP